MSFAPVVFDDVSFFWPDGRPVLQSVSAALTGRTGVVGSNGAGKSTLLRLIAGSLTPTSGRIQVSGEVGVLPQQVTLQADLRVADLMGIGRRLDAIRAIEAGAVDQQLYDLVGSEWDVEARTRAALDVVGLTDIGLERRIGSLSGGEAMLAAITGLRASRPAVTLLDEPTNNLDRPARSALIEVVAEWPGALVVVSHDRELLRTMHQTAELERARLAVYGGDYDFYRTSVDRDQAAVEQAVVTARQTLRIEERQRREAETRLARSARMGRKDVANSAFIGAAADERRRRAQQTAGKVKGKLDDRVSAAQARLDDVQARLRRAAELSATLPDPGLAANRRLFEVEDPDRCRVVAGPQRVALTGRNGVGKTRLVETLFRPDVDAVVVARPLCERIGYLPQCLDDLVDEESVLANVRTVAPLHTDGEIRGQLAGFGLGAAAVERPVSTLSGGERFTVTLARLLLAEPAPQLVVLDEPTNNLDFARVEALVAALNRYRGGVLVISHDQEFLDRIGIDTWWRLVATAEGPRLVEGQA